MNSINSNQYTERVAARQLEILILYEEADDLNLASVLENEILLGAFLGTDYQEHFLNEYIVALQKYIKSKL
ncbi:hypothetical protein ACMG5I_02975 [Escherichia coli]|uniref:hypothetical protein n=1 Tax=Escherichia coli TaxID=562 RepID=UPI0023779F22|nr:hypothetical protein vBEcoMphAPEC6_00315 [Escherichia phage ph0011]